MNNKYIGNPLGFFNDNLEKAQKGREVKGNFNRTNRQKTKCQSRTTSKNTKDRFSHCMGKQPGLFGGFFRNKLNKN
tara:strand:+ start:165 stop:392 length:228 start_codon:yes stop_codon:yes gene_type:complete